MWPTIRIRPLRCGELDELLAVPDVDRQRLLDEHVLAGFERRLGHLVVRDRRRRERHGHRSTDRTARRENRCRTRRPGIRCWQSRLDGALGVAERGQRSELVKVSNQILAPVADADDGDARTFGYALAHESAPSERQDAKRDAAVSDGLLSSIDTSRCRRRHPRTDRPGAGGATAGPRRRSFAIGSDQSVPAARPPSPPTRFRPAA